MMKRRRIIDSIIAGIKEGKDFYERISFGNWPSDGGVENIISVKIAEKLSGTIESEMQYILLEVPFSQIRRKSLSDQRTPGCSPRSRADIVIFDRKSEKPMTVIEVKRMWQKKGCIRDIDRLRHLINSRGSVKQGFLAIFQKNGNGNLKKKLIDRKRVVETHFSNNNFNEQVMFHFEGPIDLKKTNWQWSPTCFEVSPGGSK